MHRALRALAALLLASPLSAQTLRVAMPSPPTVPYGSVAAAPAAVPAILATAPWGAEVPLPRSPSVERPAAPMPLPTAPPAPALPAAAASDGLWGEASPIILGRSLFDGTSDLATRSGSVFSVSQAVPVVRGGVAYVRVKPAPVAPLKAVPGTRDLGGRELLDNVGRAAANGHRTRDYKDASRYMFSTADNHSLNGMRGVADAYSGVFVPGSSPRGGDYAEDGDADGDGWSGGQGMNVEHVFPQSYFDGKMPMRSDLHHLMATFERPNRMRGALPFGVVKTPTDYRNAAGAKRDLSRFEPPDFTKGRVARAMLYFYARYRGEAFFDRRAAAFWGSQIETLLDWNRRFPPTVEERRRNDHVEAFQGNRNPFVDDYTLADRIGLEALRGGMFRRPLKSGSGRR